MNTGLIILAVAALALAWRYGRGWLERTLEARAQAKTAQCVFIKLRVSDEPAGDPEENARLLRLEALIDQVVEAAGVGELDGYARSPGFRTFHLYGPSADRLFEVVSPGVAIFEPRLGSVAILRYGGEGAEETTV